MQKLRAILLLFYAAAWPAAALCQANDEIADEDSTITWQTPFDPEAGYQTLGLRARVLPWFLGKSGGCNVLIGTEIGFLKNHSFEVDGYYYGDHDHRDSYTGNDPQNKITANYKGSNTAVFMAYNYHYQLRHLRERLGLDAYTGFCGRVGQMSKAWDRGLSIDSVLQSNERYYAAGLQAGVILTFNEERHFAINLNVATLYTVKHLSQQSTHSMALSNNAYHFSSCDLRVGLNLYWWFRYKKK